MKKRILRLTLLLLIITALIAYKGGFNSLLKSPTAQAIGDLSVDWGVPEGNPIFVVTAVKPGDIEARTVTVHNDASTPRPVGVRAIKTSETGGLAGAFSFVISQGAVDVYGGSSPTGSKTLADFFTESAQPDGIPLSILNNGSSTSYTFTATFQSQSGNEFQNKQLVFDLKIGLSIPTPAECASIVFAGPPIFGSEQKDLLKGTNGNDLIFALEGNDIITSGNGSDCIVGGAGDDAILSGNESDVVMGNEGKDSLLGGNDGDILIGGTGDDSILGENGVDTIFGNQGIDSIHGGNGNDVISGGGDHDSIFGENGDDQIHGDGGPDSLDGGLGNDTLIGDDGVDSINGSSGIDTCIGEMKFSCEL